MKSNQCVIGNCENTEDHCFQTLANFEAESVCQIYDETRLPGIISNFSMTSDSCSVIL